MKTIKELAEQMSEGSLRIWFNHLKSEGYAELEIVHRQSNAVTISIGDSNEISTVEFSINYNLKGEELVIPMFVYAPLTPEQSERYEMKHDIWMCNNVYTDPDEAPDPYSLQCPIAIRLCRIKISNITRFE